MPLPIEFEKCPVCHSKDTICRLVCADEPSIPKGTFVSLEKLFTPIQDINRIVAPMIKGILVHFDICAKCGHRYCTKAEITSAPVQIQHRSGSALKGIGKPGYIND